MLEQFNEQKQELDEDKAPQKVERDGFTAEELGEALAYDSTTEIAQMMGAVMKPKATLMTVMLSARQLLQPTMTTNLFHDTSATQMIYPIKTEMILQP